MIALLVMAAPCYSNAQSLHVECSADYISPGLLRSVAFQQDDGIFYDDFSLEFDENGKPYSDAANGNTFQAKKFVHFTELALDYADSYTSLGARSKLVAKCIKNSKDGSTLKLPRSATKFILSRSDRDYNNEQTCKEYVMHNTLCEIQPTKH